nr:MAG: hypothetical protein [Microvirus sp.]
MAQAYPGSHRQAREVRAFARRLSAKPGQSTFERMLRMSDAERSFNRLLRQVDAKREFRARISSQYGRASVSTVPRTRGFNAVMKGGTAIARYAMPIAMNANPYLRALTIAQRLLRLSELANTLLPGIEEAGKPVPEGWIDNGDWFSVAGVVRRRHAYEENPVWDPAHATTSRTFRDRLDKLSNMWQYHYSEPTPYFSYYRWYPGEYYPPNTVAEFGQAGKKRPAQRVASGVRLEGVPGWLISYDPQAVPPLHPTPHPEHAPWRILERLPRNPQSERGYGIGRRPGRRTRTGHGIGPGGPFEPPPHRYRPPPPGTKEVKAALTGDLKRAVGIVWWMANAITETADLINLLYRLLPEDVRREMYWRGMSSRVDKRALVVATHLAFVDWESFPEEFIKMQVVDTVIGRLSSGAAKVGLQGPIGRHGPISITTGPTLGQSGRTELELY